MLLSSFYLAFERSQRIYYQPRGFPRNNKWLRVSSDYRIGRGRSRFIGRQHAFALSCASKLFFQRSLVSFSSSHLCARIRSLSSTALLLFRLFLSLTNFWNISIGKMNNCDDTIFPFDIVSIEKRIRDRRSYKFEKLLPRDKTVFYLPRFYFKINEMKNEA